MQRMTGIDPMFIYSDTPETPMEVSYTCIFDPSTRPGGYSFDAVRNLLAQRIPALPPFRRRLMEVPLGLDHPRWVDDPDFDISNHLHRAALPTPGGEHELSDLTSEVMGRPLQSDQPPWEMHLVEGLRQGRIGLIAKMHHAVIDGMSGAQLMAQLLDVSSEATASAEVRSLWRPPALPSSVRMATEALPRILTSPIRLIRAAHEVGRTSLRMARHAASGGTDSVSIPIGAPAQFGAHVTSVRDVSFAEVDLGEVVALKNRMGVSLNDVVLTVCSGALRTYLADHGHETIDSLVAVVPVSVRNDSERESMGNRLSAMFVSLGSDKEEPLERLRAVTSACASAKAQERAVGYGTLASAVSDALPSALVKPALRLGAKFRRSTSLAARKPRDLQCSWTDLSPLLRGDAHGRGLPDRSRRRRGRSEHHGSELPGLTLRRCQRLPGCGARRLCLGQFCRRRAQPLDESLRCDDASRFSADR